MVTPVFIPCAGLAGVVTGHQQARQFLERVGIRDQSEATEMIKFSNDFGKNGSV